MCAPQFSFDTRKRTNDHKPKIAVIIGSIRPNRFGDKPAKWIARPRQGRAATSTSRSSTSRIIPLPLFDAPASDIWMPTPNPEAAKWQAKLNEFDGYIIVTAEYNRSIPGALKNAIDWAYKPFIKKAVAYRRLRFGRRRPRCRAPAHHHGRAAGRVRSATASTSAARISRRCMMGQKTWDEVKGSFDAFVPRTCSTICCGGPTPPRRRARPIGAAGARPPKRTDVRRLLLSTRTGRRRHGAALSLRMRCSAHATQSRSRC